ncbi:hypothetical protein OG920_20425 [Streptomyces europaeiscabiei]|uniref:hypothetical protein n=1 Tax=Streptomyces europaeiscabiei TaxID=146819 RepID=UPI0029BA00B1|nr:hypothetical protein [Streptomyces europaeiscabiei]MDX3619330.1 hypothetical protein [Streptomyces europaeiscabiei]MDX3637758.1 hypothetical protein [Streptomyces europaeiscabiei]MDX3653321.1 hypothetical protein [Streptomyces europaeiscabiei]
MDPVSPLEQALHAARALVLADLVAGKVAEADVVSMVEDSVVQRRWWVEQWPDGVAYVGGLVAQDVQDALLERYGRWPLCPVCDDGDPHALDVEPELGPDPQWVCHKAGVRVAAVGALGSAYGAAHGEASGAAHGEATGDAFGEASGDASGEASGEAPSS